MDNNTKDFVKIKNGSFVFSKGRYVVGRHIEPGEYYFWGSDIWYDVSSSGESEHFEATDDTYHTFLDDDVLTLECGKFTPISNLEYIKHSKVLLYPKHLYKVGLEIPCGNYLFRFDKKLYNEPITFCKDNDAAFETFSSYPASRFKRNAAPIGVASVDSTTKYVYLKNGVAAFFSDIHSNIYDYVMQARLPIGQFYHDGINIYHSKICDINIYKYGSDEYFSAGSGFPTFRIREQRYYTAHNCCYWIGIVSMLSYRSFNDIYFTFESDGSDEFFEIGIDRSIDTLRMFDKEAKKVEYRVVFQLPISFYGKNVSVMWLRYNDYPQKFHLINSIAEEYYSDFENARKNFDCFPEINTNEELDYFKSCPDLLVPINNLFSEALKKREEMSEQRKETGKIIVVPVIANYDKQFYCAAKISDKAINIEEKQSPHRFLVSFLDSQIEEIELMYYSAHDPEQPEQSEWNPVVSFLNDNCFTFWLVGRINSEIANLTEKCGYSGVVTGSVLIRFIKSISKNNKEKLDAIYSEIAKENRIQSRWGNEYKLFVIVSSYVEEAVYQYHAEWLGQQSLDIFIPSQKIAIEYQGKQHYEPVDIFGGKESFEKNVERDIRKQKLSKLNGVTILYWKYDLQVNEKNVEAFLLENSVKLTAHKKAVTKNRGEIIGKLALEMAPIRDNQAQVNYGKSRKKMLSERSRPLSTTVIRQFDLDGKFIKEYDTIKDAASQMQISVKSITNAIYGSRKSGGGYIWKKCNRGSPIENTSPITKPENTGIGKLILQSDVNGKRIAVFPSKRAASRATGINERSISDVLSGVQKTAGGFKWSYAKKDNLEC